MGNTAWALDVIEDLKRALDKTLHKKARKHLTKASIAIAKATAREQVESGPQDIVVPIHGTGGKSRK